MLYPEWIKNRSSLGSHFDVDIPHRARDLLHRPPRQAHTADAVGNLHRLDDSGYARASGHADAIHTQAVGNAEYFQAYRDPRVSGSRRSGLSGAVAALGFRHLQEGAPPAGPG